MLGKRQVFGIFGALLGCVLVWATRDCSRSFLLRDAGQEDTIRAAALRYKFDQLASLHPEAKEPYVIFQGGMLLETRATSALMEEFRGHVPPVATHDVGDYGPEFVFVTGYIQWLTRDEVRMALTTVNELPRRKPTDRYASIDVYHIRRMGTVWTIVGDDARPWPDPR